MSDTSDNALVASEPPQQQNKPSSILLDAKYAYQEESNGDLRKKKRLLGVLNSRNRLYLHTALLKYLRKLNLLKHKLAHSPFFDFFLGDEDLDESLTQMGWLKDRNVTVLPDYCHQGTKGESDIVGAYGETSRSFHFAADHRNLIPFVVLKTKLLVDDKTFIKYATHPQALSEVEMEEIERFHSRFISLCRLGYDLDLAVIIDADHYLCQPIIDRYTDEVMLLFNKHKPVIFASLDLYRQDRLDRLNEIAQYADQHDLYAGIVLAEGMEKEEEKSFALKHNYPALSLDKEVAPSFLFKEASKIIFQHLDKLSLCAITHKADVCQTILNYIDSLALEKDDPRISFAQNMGVADSLTFTLSQQGYNVSKILPYGNPEDSLNALFQRHRSNRSYRLLAREERKNIFSELKRRNK